MTDSDTIRKTIRSTYEARARGDLDGTTASFADDIVFEINGQGTGLPSLATETRGKPAVQRIIKELIDNFRFSDWQEVSFVVEGDKAALHWRSKVTYAPNGHSESFDVFDFYAFRDGKVIDFRQSTDTAKIRAMLAD
jgi:ketosteroid isomerase-like protein